MSTVQEAINQQRKQIDFKVDSLGQFLYGQQRYNVINKEFLNYPRIPYDYNKYNMGRVALIKQSYQNQPLIFNEFDFNNNQKALYALISSNHQMPGSVSSMMFVKCIQYMGSEEQKQRFLKKSINFQIVGAYAQTQIGHGSDIRSLQTTATYDQKTQEFVINTPSITAAKYWPGQLGLGANWALVYAQLIIKDKSYGVHAFFVPIRNQKWQVLPGIQAGDIGPKMGYHAKQNGFMILKNIRIPRNNMLGKFNQVTSQGKYISKGDPRIAYATMMKIRLFISVICPRMYGIIITAAARYSIFRKQFKNKSGQIKILDYQTQQDKIISRIAESYSILSAGHFINEIALKNQELIKKGDSRLMQQTHILLSVSKALFSEIVLDGMQICRKACGGHGYSHYAGFNVALGQYYTNPTHQGQNTILYLQVAKYILKNYQYFMTKSKPLGQSVKYIQSIQYYQNYKSKISQANQWNSNQIRIIITQGCIFMISQITSGLLSKDQNMNQVEYFNFLKGSKLQKLAIVHGYKYILECFIERIMAYRNQKNKDILNDLCLLFGLNVLLNSNISHLFIEGGFVSINQIQSLKELKCLLLQKLRPKTIGLIDAYGFPQHLIRSELAKGNPYENYFKKAQQCQINQKIQESAFIIKQIKNRLNKARL